ncbi:helix-turn-helix domain-containing protein [Pimelobacter sp. 30-1]|uniref:helix-turn-helix domain-containing protein n=1 Tax=Pimelobacter sp. 30-1 TaxID=2004991 RepID=UPI001C03DA72|nr:helix-turn-helix transcriptional regulator [Pimelobacter sp. 30-1]MBU2697088.1 transcriptional regulator [Pimelobacter sp. 30-1]
MAEEQKAAEPLWRDVLGRRLRDLRRERGETLTETAQRAGISPQYLSEIERGIKEPSSEMIAAVAGALGLTLLDLTAAITGDLSVVRSGDGLRSVPAGTSASVSVLALAA